MYTLRVACARGVAVSPSGGLDPVCSQKPEGKIGTLSFLPWADREVLDDGAFTNTEPIFY